MFGWIKDNVWDPLSGRTAKDAAKAQVEAIKDAQSISEEAAEQARMDALSLFAPSLDVLQQGFQQARNDLLSGQQSASNLFNQSFLNSSNAIQQGSQQSINALLGLPSTATQVEQSKVIQQNPQVIESIQQGEKITPGLVRGDVTGVDNNVPTTISAKGMPSSDRAAFDGLRLSPTGQVIDGVRMTEGIRTAVQPQPEGLATQQVINSANQGLAGELTPSQLAQAQAPQFTTGENIGLAGVESALQGSLVDQLGAMSTGAQAGLGALGSGFDTARGNIADARALGLGAISGAGEMARGDITTGLENGLGSLQSGYDTATGQLADAKTAGLGYLASGADIARGDISQFADVGRSALDKEAALTGALGPEAQAAAFAEYSESPGQAYMREQQEKALLRNQAATGGLGGGNVLKELQRQAAGLASQNYQQDLANLRSLSQRGQQAAGDMSGIAERLGTSQAGLEQAIGGGLANLATGLGQQRAGLQTQAGSQLANIAQNVGQQVAGLEQATGQSLAELASSQGLTESQLLNNLGLSQASAIGNVGNQLAGARQQTGQDIANVISGATGQTAGLQQGLGQQLANLDLQTAGNLANLGTGLAQGQTQGLQGLASLLSNMAIGQGTQQAGLAQNLGQAQAGQIGANQSFLNNAAQIAGLASMFSDSRLKKNINKMFSIKGVDFVSWDWNGKLGLVGSGFGVIAQDVKETIKDAVTLDDSGYYKVDYSKVLEFVR